ncbi:MAG TPA: hypothetical protein VF223_19180 [Trebonia sp.]
MAEKLEFDLLARGNAADQFLKTGRAAASASDDVLGLARRLDEVGRRNAQARVGVKGDKETQLALDRLDFRMQAIGRRLMDPKISVQGAARASLEIAAIDVELDKLARHSEDAATSATSLGASIGKLSNLGMPALIAAATGLSPALVTMGTGMAGFGLAAEQSLAPVFKSKDGIKGLDSAQQGAYRSLSGLKAQVGQFTAALEPETIGVFSRAVGLAGHVLHDVQPVAAATGKAVDGLLGRVDQEFQSGTWQGFFDFMSKTAGPDVQLLGNNLTDLMNVLPGLLENLQPVATTLLNTTDGAVKLAGAVVKISTAEKNFSEKSQASGGALGFLARAAGKAYDQLVPGASAANTLRKRIGELGSSASGPATSGLATMDTQVQTTNTSVETLTGSLKALNGLLNDESAYIAWKQSQQAATKAIEGGSAALDGNSKKALANRQQVIDSTQKLVSFIGQEQKSGVSVGKMSGQIQDQIHWLQSSGDKSDWLKRQVADLEKTWRALHSRKVAITVTGSGSWAVVQGGHRLLGPGQQFSAAQGMLVTGGIPGVDSVPVLAQRDELMVPRPIVRSGAVDHLAGMIPGWQGAARMAAGGLIGSIQTGQPSKLGPWAQHNYAATQVLIEQATAKAAAAALNALGRVFGGGGGPGGGAPAANAALARRMFPGEDFAAWNYVAMRESGWNQFARNPSSGAYGIPQALPPTKLPFAGQAAGGSNPAAQITWMEGYMRGRYGGAAGAAAHERAFGWYGGGLHATISRPTLIGVGERGPERVDVTPAAQARSGPLVQINGMVVREAADVAVLAQKVSWAITASGF